MAELTHVVLVGLVRNISTRSLSFIHSSSTVSSSPGRAPSSLHFFLLAVFIARLAVDRNTVNLNVLWASCQGPHSTITMSLQFVCYPAGWFICAL